MENIVRKFIQRELGAERVDYRQHMELQARCFGSIGINIGGAPSAPVVASWCREQQDGHLLAVAAETGWISIFNTSNNSGLPDSLSFDPEYCHPKISWEAHQNMVYDVAWAKGDTRLLTCSGDGSTGVWDIATARMVSHCNQYESVKCLSVVDSCQDVFAAGDRGGNIVLWDMRVQGKRCRKAHTDGQGQVTAEYDCLSHPYVHRIEKAHGGPPPSARLGSARRKAADSGVKATVNTLAFVPGTWVLASGGTSDTVVKFWDMRKTCEPAAVMSPAPHAPSPAGGITPGPPCRRLAAIPAAASPLFVTPKTKSRGRGWDGGWADEVMSFDAAGSKGCTAGIICLNVVPGRGEILATCSDKRIHAYSISHPDRGPRATFLNPTPGNRHQHSWFIKTQVSPDESSFVTGAFFDDHNAYVFDLSQPNKAPVVLEGHVGSVGGVAWCGKDARQVATCSDDATVRLWNLEWGRPTPGGVTSPAPAAGTSALPPTVTSTAMDAPGFSTPAARRTRAARTSISAAGPPDGGQDGEVMGSPGTAVRAEAIASAVGLMRRSSRAAAGASPAPAASPATAAAEVTPVAGVRPKRLCVEGLSEVAQGDDPASAHAGYTTPSPLSSARPPRAPPSASLGRHGWAPRNPSFDETEAPVAVAAANTAMGDGGEGVASQEEAEAMDVDPLVSHPPAAGEGQADAPPASGAPIAAAEVVNTTTTAEAAAAATAMVGGARSETPPPWAGPAAHDTWYVGTTGSPRVAQVAEAAADTAGDAMGSHSLPMPARVRVTARRFRAQTTDGAGEEECSGYSPSHPSSLVVELAGAAAIPLPVPGATVATSAGGCPWGAAAGVGQLAGAPAGVAATDAGAGLAAPARPAGVGAAGVGAAGVHEVGWSDARLMWQAAAAAIASGGGPPPSPNPSLDENYDFDAEFDNKENLPPPTDNPMSGRRHSTSPVAVGTGSQASGSLLSRSPRSSEGHHRSPRVSLDGMRSPRSLDGMRSPRALDVPPSPIRSEGGRRLSGGSFVSPLAAALQFGGGSAVLGGLGGGGSIFRSSSHNSLLPAQPALPLGPAAGTGPLLTAAAVPVSSGLPMPSPAPSPLPPIPGPFPVLAALGGMRAKLGVNPLAALAALGGPAGLPPLPPTSHSLAPPGLLAAGAQEPRQPNLSRSNSFVGPSCQLASQQSGGQGQGHRPEGGEPEAGAGTACASAVAAGIHDKEARNSLSGSYPGNEDGVVVDAAAAQQQQQMEAGFSHCQQMSESLPQAPEAGVGLDRVLSLPSSPPRREVSAPGGEGAPPSGRLLSAPGSQSPPASNGRARNGGAPALARVGSTADSSPAPRTEAAADKEAAVTTAVTDTAGADGAGCDGAGDDPAKERQPSSASAFGRDHLPSFGGWGTITSAANVTAAVTAPPGIRIDLPLETLRSSSLCWDLESPAAFGLIIPAAPAAAPVGGDPHPGQPLPQGLAAPCATSSPVSPGAVFARSAPSRAQAATPGLQAARQWEDAMPAVDTGAVVDTATSPSRNVAAVPAPHVPSAMNRQHSLQHWASSPLHSAAMPMRQPVPLRPATATAATNPFLAAQQQVAAREVEGPGKLGPGRGLIRLTGAPSPFTAAAAAVPAAPAPSMLPLEREEGAGKRQKTGAAGTDTDASHCMRPLLSPSSTKAPPNSNPITRFMPPISTGAKKPTHTPSDVLPSGPGLLPLHPLPASKTGNGGNQEGDTSLPGAGATVIIGYAMLEAQHPPPPPPHVAACLLPPHPPVSPSHRAHPEAAREAGGAPSATMPPKPVPCNNSQHPQPNPANHHQQPQQQPHHPHPQDANLSTPLPPPRQPSRRRRGAGATSTVGAATATAHGGAADAAEDGWASPVHATPVEQLVSRTPLTGPSPFSCFATASEGSFRCPSGSRGGSGRSTAGKRSSPFPSILHTASRGGAPSPAILTASASVGSVGGPFRAGSSSHMQHHHSGHIMSAMHMQISGHISLPQMLPPKFPSPQPAAHTQGQGVHSVSHNNLSASRSKGVGEGRDAAPRGAARHAGEAAAWGTARPHAGAGSGATHGASGAAVSSGVDQGGVGASGASDSGAGAPVRGSTGSRRGGVGGGKALSRSKSHAYLTALTMDGGGSGGVEQSSMSGNQAGAEDQGSQRGQPLAAGRAQSCMGGYAYMGSGLVGAGGRLPPVREDSDLSDGEGSELGGGRGCSEGGSGAGSEGAGSAGAGRSCSVGRMGAGGLDKGGCDEAVSRGGSQGQGSLQLSVPAGVASACKRPRPIATSPQSPAGRRRALGGDEGGPRSMGHVVHGADGGCHGGMSWAWAQATSQGQDTNTTTAAGPIRTAAVITVAAGGGAGAGITPEKQQQPATARSVPGGGAPAPTPFGSAGDEGVVKGGGGSGGGV